MLPLVDYLIVSNWSLILECGLNELIRSLDNQLHEQYAWKRVHEIADYYIEQSHYDCPS